MYTTKLPRILCTFALVMIFNAGAQAAEHAYKWVDKDGVVHYDQQPPTSTESEALKIRQSSSATVENAAPKLTDEQKQVVAAAEFCRVATENFNLVSSGGDVQRKDANGDAHIMSAEEKEAVKASSKATMELYCKPEPASKAP